MNLWATAANGPVKYPVIRTKSDRVDVEVIGPSEALDLETECGSGLCQQLAGDFLFHCHVAHHYVAGMWGILARVQHPATGRIPQRRDAGSTRVAGSQRTDEDSDLIRQIDRPDSRLVW
jgi:hypothetical protein